MANLDYIEELGVGVEDTPSEEAVDTEPKAVEEPTQETEDLTLDSSEEESQAQEDTEPTELEKLRLEYEQSIKDREVMQKRLDDSQEYINKLREESKAREESAEKTEEVNDDDEYWDDPVAYTKKLKEEFEQKFRVQQLQIAETHFANTVEDYWKTVNPDALKEAVATDGKFAEEFNSSHEPYKTAYEYLSQKNKAKAESESTLREQIRQELLAEMGAKKPKEAPPSVPTGASSNATKSNAPDDGFASVFGA